MTDVPNRSPGVTAELVLLGIDASWASVEEREALKYDAATAAALLSYASDLPGLEEALVLSTCNRTEFYLVATAEAVASFRAEVCHGKRSTERARISSHTSLLRFEMGDAVVRHACAVASGAASTILGDAFIIRQMKQALAQASDCGTLGPVLNRVFALAFDTAHDARRHTDIARGDTGLGAVVASAIANRVPGHPRILLVGAGVTAQDVAFQISKRQTGHLRLINRTAANGQRLAAAVGAQWCEWTGLGAEVALADVVICATGAQQPIISSGTLGDRRPLLVDLGVPRNIEVPPGCANLSIDDLVACQDDAREQRAAAVADVLEIVEDAVLRWHAWVDTRPLEGQLKELFANEADVRTHLAAELVSRGWPGTLAEAEQLIARRTAPMLKRHAAELRHWARHVLPRQADRCDEPVHR